MRLLIRFSKDETVRFLSHLDMQRLLHRALRRAKLPCAYSQGFNPHLLLSFACALPVGTSSRAEYAEVTLEKDVPPASAVQALNEALPGGVRVLAARAMGENEKGVGSRICRALYRLDADILAEDAARIMNSDTLTAQKKTKTGITEVNIRPLIFDLHVQVGTLYALVACSNSENLRADVLAAALKARGISVGLITRTKLFITDGAEIVEPIGDTV